MTREQQQPKGLVDNATVTVLSRLAILAATFLGLPTAVWMLDRSVKTVDQMADKIEQIKAATTDMTSNMRNVQLQQEYQGKTLADHENRIRYFERIQRTGASSATPTGGTPPRAE